MATDVLIALAVCGVYLAFFAVGNWFPGTGGTPQPAPTGGDGDE